MRATRGGRAGAGAGAMWRRGAGAGACALLLCALVAAKHDDDFAFDNGDDLQAEIANSSGLRSGLKRLWGIPDTTAYVGHLFRVEIPTEAFSGDVVAYKVRGADGRRAPAWLAVDARHGLLSGVPLAADVGAHALHVTAHQRHGVATDTFTVEVKECAAAPQSREVACGASEGRVSLQLLLAARLQRLRPRQRTRALMHLANFMALDGEEFSIETYKSSAGAHADLTVLQSGPGSSQRGRGDAATTAIHLNVGCGRTLWPRRRVLVAGVREQARDGTLAHLLELPVLGWRLVAERPPPPPVRPKRQLAEDGSGGYYDGDDGDDADYSGYDEDADDYDFSPDPDATYTKLQIVPSSVGAPRAVNVTAPSVSRSLDLPVVIVPDPSATTTERTPTVLIQASSEPESPSTDFAVPSSSGSETSSTAIVPPSSTTTTSTTTSTTTTTTTTTTSTTPRPTVGSTPETTLEVTRRQEAEPSTEKSSTIIGRTTETIDFRLPVTVPPNRPPQLMYHMRKLPVTAGKAFRYLIPEDLFKDPDDNLTYAMFDSNNATLNYSSWVQFMPAQREVYGLPLDEHVSRWSYKVQATDSSGAKESAPLDITVQHHKEKRTFNHHFAITFKVQRKYPAAIDWQIRALEGLVNLLRDTDMEDIVVRNVSAAGDLVAFLWSDDKLAKDVCPTADIQRIMAILESDTEKGSPSANLTRVMLPDLKVSAVAWAGAGACEAAAAPPPRRPPSHLDNFPPMPRNQVDLVQATAGHLLVFKVPEDTFYDLEDGDTRHLNLSVITGDRKPLPSAHWMQFDRANQEFYGLPTDRDVGKREYQLIAHDSIGQSISDMLLVEVNPAPPIQPPVEFQMSMNARYAALASSALAKRTFFESLARLFGDKDASSIRVKSITGEPTTVVWFNTSLPMDRCPDGEIEALKRIIIKEEQQGSPESLTERVDVALGAYEVMAIRLVPRGLCALQSPAAPPRTPVSVQHAPSAERERSAAGVRDYVVTFVVPAVVVVCMILVAGIIACVLYRRRRTGKMSVGDEEERQAFRSKGIPVIFQDELEDKPEPGNKAPVIMPEEKPPLLPPPDYRAGSPAPAPAPSPRAPYRPPPPFAVSAGAPHPPRPKPTPTYRKPPPYVPP